METKDWLFVLSTLVAPLFAVQATRFLDRKRQDRQDQLSIFKTLMATRAANLDPRHVEALNMIDVVFHADSKPQVEIRRHWKHYLDHLSDKSYPKELWGSRRVEILVELLYAMARHLGLDFDKTHIKNQCYYPEGYGTVESEQEVIRHALREILTGQHPLPVWVANLTHADKK